MTSLNPLTRGLTTHGEGKGFSRGGARVPGGGEGGEDKCLDLSLRSSPPTSRGESPLWSPSSLENVQVQATSVRKRGRSRRSKVTTATQQQEQQLAALTLDDGDDDDEDRVTHPQQQHEQQQTQQQQEPEGGQLGVETTTATSTTPHERPRGTIPWSTLSEATDGPQAFLNTSPSGRSLVGAAEQQQTQQLFKELEKLTQEDCVRRWLALLLSVVERRFALSISTQGHEAVSETLKSLQSVEAQFSIVERRRWLNTNALKKTRLRVGNAVERARLVTAELHVALSAPGKLPLGIFDPLALVTLQEAARRAAAVLGIAVEARGADAAAQKATTTTITEEVVDPEDSSGQEEDHDDYECEDDGEW